MGKKKSSISMEDEKLMTSDLKTLPYTVKTSKGPITIIKATPNSYQTKTPREADRLEKYLHEGGHGTERHGKRTIHVFWKRKGLQRINEYFVGAGITAMAVYIPQIISGVILFTPGTPAWIGVHLLIATLIVLGYIKQSGVKKRNSFVSELF